MARSFATNTRGGTSAPEGSVRRLTLQGNPGIHGRRSEYDTVTSGWGPGTTVVADESRPAEKTGTPSAKAMWYAAMYHRSRGEIANGAPALASEGIG